MGLCTQREPERLHASAADNTSSRGCVPQIRILQLSGGFMFCADPESNSTWQRLCESGGDAERCCRGFEHQRAGERAVGLMSIKDAKMRRLFPN